MAIVEDCHHSSEAARQQPRHYASTKYLSPNCPGLWADERAIRQICLNLLSNAIKFTPQDGRNLAEGRVDRLWRPIHQCKRYGTGASRKRKSQSCSLPLVRDRIRSNRRNRAPALACRLRKLVDLHGGTFTLKSKLRIGTEVTVTFPPERVVAAMAPMLETAPPIALTNERSPPPNERSGFSRRPLFRAGT